jgi:hypothetical protein
MTSLGEDVYVGTLNYNELNPPISGSSIDLSPLTLKPAEDKVDCDGDLAFIGNRGIIKKIADTFHIKNDETGNNVMTVVGDPENNDTSIRIGDVDVADDRPCIHITNTGYFYKDGISRIGLDENGVRTTEPINGSRVGINSAGESGFACSINAESGSQEGSLALRDKIGENTFQMKGDIADKTMLCTIGDIDGINNGFTFSVDDDKTRCFIRNGTLNIPNIPTVATGLSTGDVWNNGGVLNIV